MFCLIESMEVHESNSLDFCDDQNFSLGSNLKNMDAEQFCNRMGFPVPDQGGCYDGIPTASIVKASNKPPSKSKKPDYSKAATWDAKSIAEGFFYGCKIFGLTLIGVSFCVCIFSALYWCNSVEIEDEKLGRINKKDALSLI